ncbi:MAG: hypothetical protein IJ499_04415 [Clostridia bacterium]|nr:hypothetical protein [Clostridia bacterium]
MEQIYTIPVNEAFEKCAVSGGCPFCELYSQLDFNEIDLILGASMMEPDVRKKTNEMGFCADHFESLFAAGKKLPLALILESHLKEVEGLVSSPGLMPAVAGASAAKKLGEATCSCYICSRIEYNFSRMLQTAAYLWETDEDFRRKCKGQEGYCIPHFSRFVSAAKSRMKSKTFAEFYRSVYATEEKHISGISNKLSRFVKSFDYRYANEPIEDARDAVEKTIKLISGREVKR